MPTTWNHLPAQQLQKSLSPMVAHDKHSASKKSVRITFAVWNMPKPAGSLFSTETANEKVSELGLPPDMVWVSIHPFWHCAPFRMPECTPAAAEKMTPSTFGAMMSAWESTVTHACGAWSG